MALFEFNWTPNINSGTIAQRVSYRQKSIGGDFISTGFNPANDLSITASSITINGLLNNVIYEFKLQNICQVGGAIDGRIGEFIVFECPIISLSATKNIIIVNIPEQNEDIKIKYTLWDEQQLIKYDTIISTDNQTTFTNVEPNTKYIVKVELIANINNVDIISPCYSTTSITTQAEQSCGEITNLIISNSTSNSLSLSWYSTEDNFKVSYKLPVSSTWIDFITTTDNFVTITGLNSSLTYDIKITSNCGTVNTIQGTTNTVQCTPIQNLSVYDETGDSVTISWTSSSDINRYEVRYKKVSDLYWNTFITNASNPTIVYGLELETAYNFEVIGYCNIGNVFSYINGNTTSEIIEDCNSVSNLRLLYSDYNSLNIAWNSISNAEQYIIEYKKSSDSIWIEYGETNFTNITIEGLEENTDYDIRVLTDCGSSQSEYSNITLTTESQASSCSPVTNVNITLNDTTAIFTWTNSSEAISYNFLYRLVGDTWIEQNNINSPITLNGLESGDYEYKIVSICSSSNEEYTGTFSLSNSSSCGTVVNTSYVSEPTSVTISWDALSGAEYYEVVYRQNGSFTWIDAPNTTTNNIVLSGLSENEFYEVSITPICEGNTAGDSTDLNAMTYCNKLEANKSPIVGIINSDTWFLGCKGGLYTLPYTIVNENPWEKSNIEISYQDEVIASIYDLPDEEDFLEFIYTPTIPECSIKISYFTSVPIRITETGTEDPLEVCDSVLDLVVYGGNYDPTTPLVGRTLYEDPKMVTVFDGQDTFHKYQAGGYIYTVKINSSGVITEINSENCPTTGIYNVFFSNNGKNFPTDILISATSSPPAFPNNVNDQLGPTEKGWTVSTFPNTKGQAHFSLLDVGSYNFAITLQTFIPSVFPMPRRKLTVYKNGNNIIEKKLHFVVGTWGWSTGSITIEEDDIIEIRLN